MTNQIIGFSSWNEASSHDQIKMTLIQLENDHKIFKQTNFKVGTRQKIYINEPRRWNMTEINIKFGWTWPKRSSFHTDAGEAGFKV